MTQLLVNWQAKPPAIAEKKNVLALQDGGLEPEAEQSDHVAPQAAGEQMES